MTSVENIRLIAVNEFVMMLYHPVTIVVFCLLVTFAVLNGLGGLSMLPGFESVMEEDVFIKIGMTQEFSSISLYCLMAALVLGVLSIAEERRRAICVLLTKPLYRRDIVTGKLIGLSLFIFLMITVTYLLVCLIVALIFRGPLSLSDFILRFTALIFIMSLHCSLFAGIGMLIGLVFSTLKEAIIICITVLFIEGFSNGVFQDFFGMLDPVNVYYKMFNPTRDVILLYPEVLFNTWLEQAIPFIVLTLVEIVLVFTICCYLSMRLED